MAECKSIWSKPIPTNDGWYWIKFHGKHGLTKKPCEVTWLSKTNVIVHVGSESFTAESRTFFDWDEADFGPEIPKPD